MEQQRNMNTDQIILQFKKARSTIGTSYIPTRPGIYAFYLNSDVSLGSFQMNKDRFLYVGSSSNLAEREFDNHFNSEQTGFSTLRRSLGALLKAQLDLVVLPRGSGDSESNFRNYKFQGDGEKRLTNWMKEHLDFGFCEVHDYDAQEKLIIGRLQPFLNLTNWKNPAAATIKGLRKICADEARLRYSRNL